MIPVYSENSATKLGKNTFAESVYFDKTVLKVLSYISEATWTLQKRWIFKSELVKETTSTTKISLSGLKITTANSFFSIFSIDLVVSKASMMIYSL